MDTPTTSASLMVVNIQKSILERGVLKPLNISPTQTEVQIFLDENVLFNSMGIQEWIMWLSPIAKDPSKKLTLFKCPVVMVRQINMLKDFLPKNASIQSFFVPYFSEKSGETKCVLFTRGQEFIGSELKPPVVKDSTGDLMEMDVVETSYFRFLK
jgi:hypothetical protein